MFDIFASFLLLVFNITAIKNGNLEKYLPIMKDTDSNVLQFKRKICIY